MNFIVNPTTNVSYSIFSNEGKTLLKNYVKSYHNHNMQLGGGGGATAQERQNLQIVLADKYMWEGSRKNIADLLGIGTITPKRVELGEHIKLVDAAGKAVVNVKISLNETVHDLQKIIFNYLNDSIPFIMKSKGTITNMRGIHIFVYHTGKLLESSDILSAHFKSGDEVKVTFEIENDYEPYIEDIADLVTKMITNLEIQSHDHVNERMVRAILDLIFLENSELNKKLNSNNIPVWAQFYEGFYYQNGIIDQKYVANLFGQNPKFWKLFSTAIDELDPDHESDYASD